MAQQYVVLPCCFDSSYCWAMISGYRPLAEKRRACGERPDVRLDESNRVVDVGELHDLAGRVHVAKRDRDHAAGDPGRRS